MDASPYKKVMDGIAVAVSGAIKASGWKEVSLANTIDLSKGSGDVSCSVAFKLAKELKKAPNEIAGSIASALGPVEYVAKAVAEGGYVNFYLDRRAFSEAVLAYTSGLSKTGIASGIGSGSKVIIEYPSVNPNKPWHIGHLRNALLGDAIANIHDACGYSVEREDFINDLGLQVAESMWGYMNLGDKPEGKFDTWLGAEYVKVNKKVEEDKEVKAEVGRLTALMEQDGTYEAKLHREISEKCVMAQYETSFKYGIYHDVLIWEGDLLGSKLLDKAMEMLEKAHVATKSQEAEYKGCFVIDLSSAKELPKELQGLKETIKVLVRSDGTPAYVAKDIAFHMWKFGLIPSTFKYSPFIDKQPNGKPLYTTASEGKPMGFGGVKKAINIIDVKQSFPQAILKLSFSALGRDDIANGIEHLAYGRVELEGETLAGRKGTWEGYTADLLLEETTNKALSLIGTRFNLTESEQTRIARIIALSAIKFEFLKMAPEKWITFSWKWALNFDGDSGPYCQYMHARASRLMEDSKIGREYLSAGIDCTLIVGDKEFALVKLISLAAQMAEKACNELRPNVMTDYVIDLSGAFSKFYEAVPVLKAKSEEEKKARLGVVLAFTQAMKFSLGLLGIEAIDRM
jgi:arginyl-tRNA synthetase